MKGPGSIGNSPIESEHNVESIAVQFGWNAGYDLITLQGQNQVVDDGLMPLKNNHDPCKLPDLICQSVLL